MNRLIISLAVLAVSAPSALAQVDHRAAMRDLDLTAQQQMQQQRSIALENQFNALDAKVQTEQRIREVDIMRTRPSLTLPPKAAPAADQVGMAGFASMPDDMLAGSNARVREASQNRR
ncbi:MAG: hypothetical protein Q7T84_18000 [Phenylobacterium sp.]|uniref:hypothetical protein n=1 Tax=Phenylobacterium sp. TaxID=1871053 RepID=UPI00271F528F|nr:hypothetical protein [Phenylobacterium sp.]MDO9433196.1 hypothetical protein [Phenylobacterium sp.]